LGSLADIASTHFLPFTCQVPPKPLLTGSQEEEVALLIGAGVTGLLAGSHMVPSLKEIVRGLSYTECRAKLREILNSQLA
jgi:hypothetical protein